MLCTFIYNVCILCSFHIFILFVCRPFLASDDTSREAAYRVLRTKLFESWGNHGLLYPQTAFWSQHAAKDKIAMVTPFFAFTL